MFWFHDSDLCDRNETVDDWRKERGVIKEETISYNMLIK